MFYSSHYITVEVSFFGVQITLGMKHNALYYDLEREGICISMKTLTEFQNNLKYSYQLTKLSILKFKSQRLAIDVYKFNYLIPIYLLNFLFVCLGLPSLL